MRFSLGALGAAVAVVSALAPAAAPAQALAGKKVLFVNSYHEGYEWSDAEEKGARTTFVPTGAELRFFRMDAKRHADDAFRKAAGLKAKAEIESYKPDAVIVADDVSIIYLLKPYFRDAKIPFVFCGVNWDASKYGLPYKNATGMIEVSFAREMLNALKPYAKGPRIGYLTIDSETERVEADAYKNVLGIKLDAEIYVKTAADWKEAFKRLQNQVDILFLGNYAGSTDAWDQQEMAAFALANGRIASGSIYDFMAPYAMLSFAKVPEEHGAWAAATVIGILKGKSPADIPMARNKQSKVVLNPKLAGKLGIVFQPELVRNAVIAR